MFFTILLLVILVIYHMLAFGFIENVLEGSKLTKLRKLVISIIISFLIIEVGVSNNISPVISYIMFGVLFLGILYISFNDTLSRYYFIMITILVHIMCVRLIVVSIYALKINCTPFEIINNRECLTITTIITFALLTLSFLIVIKFIDPKKVKIINQNKEQLGFMNSWMTIFALYLIIDSRIYSVGFSNEILIQIQMTAGVCILIGIYVNLFFSIKMGVLLGYKEKSEQLEKKFTNELLYRNLVEKDVILSFNVNFTKNYIEKGMEYLENKLGFSIETYEQMIECIWEEGVFYEDKEYFKICCNRENIINRFNCGETEISFDCRMSVEDDEYIWTRIFIPIMQDKQNGEISGFIQIKDIDKTKRERLELQNRAEKDLLTGLYNKITTENLISRHLYDENGKEGVLFIIDVDNFKTINDKLGHINGDVALTDVSKELSSLFREYDIVGRVGGDEFIVFSIGYLKKEIIERKANQICESFRKTYWNENKTESYSISSSIGIAIAQKHGNSFKELYKYADMALYATKCKGKNGFTIYEKNIEKFNYVSERQI